MIEIEWRTERVKLKDLKDYEHNPRKMTKKAFDKLVQSIKEDGYHSRIKVNKDYTIIGGHSRKKALLKAGLKLNDEIEVLVPSRFIEPRQFDAINIRDNLPYGEFDNDILADRFDIEDLLEFGMPDDWLPDPINALKEGLTDDDIVPDTPIEAISKLGDLYILGKHRLLCGDSTNERDVSLLLNGERPNTMITDPPYGVAYEASWRAKAKGVKMTSREKSNSLENDSRADWLDAYMLFPGSVAYVWHASAFTDVIMQNLRDCGFDIKQQIIWNKNVHALSRSDYQWKHEPCWYAVKKGKDRTWLGGRNQMTVWDVPSIIFEKDKTSHPTQKPVELYIRSIEHHTNEGEYVYDPFCGSGTMIIACEKTNRRALCMELDPKFADVIVKRWENHTGEKAIKEGTM